jgi:hypothetical protein
LEVMPKSLAASFAEITLSSSVTGIFNKIMQFIIHVIQ